MILPLGHAIEKQCAIREPCVAVRRDLPHHGIRHDLEIAGRQSARQQQVDRAGEFSGRSSLLSGRDIHALAGSDEPLDGHAVARVILEEDAVRQLPKTLFAAGHAEHRLDPIVIRREVFVLDRPVIAETVVIFALEFVIAEPPGGAAPAQRLSADQPDAHPVIGIVRVVGIRILLLVRPDIGVELAGLGDVREAARASETTVGKVVDGLESAVPLEVDGRACVQHQALHALLRQRMRHHTSGRAGPDDQDIMVAVHTRYSIGNQ